MNALDDSILKIILANNGSALSNDESDIVEYKSTFDWSNNELRAKYSKSIAALCNAKGGYLVFGIADKTRDILGISGFDQVDPASIADHLNNYFSPSIVFFKRSVSLAGKEIGILYVAPHNDIPTICIKTFSTILKDGALFYRYPGKSEIINGTDLIHLLHQLRGKEGKELTDLKKTELKQAALPILQTAGGGSAQNTFDFKIKNLGKRAKIDSIKITKGNLNIFPHSIPNWLEQNQEARVEGANIDGVPMSFVPYELEIYYSDSIGTKYLIIANGKGAHVKFADPIEL